jgi:hypothetical protein
MEAVVIDGSNRRHAQRASREEGRIVNARIRPGHDAEIVDVSSTGALVETGRRLLPGAVVDLQIERPGERTTIRGRVVRCSVSRLDPDVRYCGAIAFEGHLAWFGVDPESATSGDQRPGRHPRVAPTPWIA